MPPVLRESGRVTVERAWSELRARNPAVGEGDKLGFLLGYAAGLERGADEFRAHRVELEKRLK